MLFLASLATLVTLLEVGLALGALAAGDYSAAAGWALTLPITWRCCRTVCRQWFWLGVD